MKPVTAVLAALFVLSLTGAAQARSVDCSRAVTRLDAAICSDPEMADYDRRIAAAHARALAIWDGAIGDYVRRDQQQWLTAFRTIETLESAIEDDCVISDLACIRAELRRRVDDVESGVYVHSGVYRAAGGMKLLLHPRGADGYRLRVYDPARLPGANVATRNTDRAALWDGPHQLVSVMGDGNGSPLPAGDGCTLRLQPEALSIRVVQQGACGGHEFGGSYARLLGETLLSYELRLY